MFIKFHFKWIRWLLCVSAVLWVGEWEKKDNYDCPLAFGANSTLYLFILFWFFSCFFPCYFRVTFRIFVVSVFVVGADAIYFFSHSHSRARGVNNTHTNISLPTDTEREREKDSQMNCAKWKYFWLFYIFLQNSLAFSVANRRIMPTGECVF